MRSRGRRGPSKQVIDRKKELFSLLFLFPFPALQTLSMPPSLIARADSLEQRSPRGEGKRASAEDGEAERRESFALHLACFAFFLFNSKVKVFRRQNSFKKKKRAFFTPLFYL